MRRFPPSAPYPRRMANPALPKLLGGALAASGLLLAHRLVSGRSRPDRRPRRGGGAGRAGPAGAVRCRSRRGTSQPAAGGGAVDLPHRAGRQADGAVVGGADAEDRLRLRRAEPPCPRRARPGSAARARGRRGHGGAPRQRLPARELPRRHGRHLPPARRSASGCLRRDRRAAAAARRADHLRPRAGPAVHRRAGAGDRAAGRPRGRGAGAGLQPGGGGDQEAGAGPDLQPPAEAGRGGGPGRPRSGGREPRTVGLRRPKTATVRGFRCRRTPASPRSPRPRRSTASRPRARSTSAPTPAPG